MGTYSDGSKVRIIGRRNGFTYITFVDGPSKGVTCKVPASWVTEDEVPDATLRRAAGMTKSQAVGVAVRLRKGHPVADGRVAAAYDALADVHWADTSIDEAWAIIRDAVATRGLGGAA